MLTDRNVFARVVALATGATAKQEHQIPAAIMAFAQCAGIEIEPNLALYEGVATQTANRATHDLAMFQAADNLHPSKLVDVALGRAPRIPHVVPQSYNLNLTALSKPIRQYSFVYPLVLKIGLVELEGGPMTQRMCRFLDWSYDNWYFSAPAITFAAICFSCGPPKNVFKHLRHPDRSLALKRLRNCAWDLSYITWWAQLLKRQNDQNCLYLLCSIDKTLRCVAQQLLAKPDTDEVVTKVLRDLLGVVYDHYIHLIERQNDPNRLVNRIGETSIGTHRAQVVAALERQLTEVS